jgi:CheY-like chemotaxis protein
VAVVIADRHDAVNEAVAHRSNMVVMDVSMPIMEGVETTRQIL